jgi:glycosyltransferase involved in cell wall biosynthesis
LALREVAVAVPGDLATPTGGYAYDRRVMAELSRIGWSVRHIELPGDFPEPSPESLAESARLFGTVAQDIPLVVDGLAYGVLPDSLLKTLRQRVIALVHHPLGLETGLPPARAAMLIASERAALDRAAAVVVTSPATADTLTGRFGVPAARIIVALPGVEPASRASGTGVPPRLLSVGSVVPRKGYDVLVRALARVADLPWTCRIVGSTDRSETTTANVKELIAASGLSGRIMLVGALGDDELAVEYAAADLFVLASHYEGYGMVFAEALARGLPIVACAGGATATTVPADAGLLVEPGDVEGLASAVTRLLADPAERARRADAAWAHAAALPRWADTARRISTVLEAAP